MSKKHIIQKSQWIFSTKWMKQSVPQPSPSFLCRLIPANCSLITQVELTQTHRGWTSNFFLEQRFYRMFNLVFIYVWLLWGFFLRNFQRKKKNSLRCFEGYPLSFCCHSELADGNSRLQELSSQLVSEQCSCQENWEGHRGTSSQPAFGQEPCQDG